MTLGHESLYTSFYVAKSCMPESSSATNAEPLFDVSYLLKLTSLLLIIFDLFVLNVILLFSDKGVKVDLGIPYELWDKPSAEITNLKSQVFMLQSINIFLYNYYQRYWIKEDQFFIYYFFFYNCSAKVCLKILKMLSKSGI